MNYSMPNESDSDHLTEKKEAYSGIEPPTTLPKHRSSPNESPDINSNTESQAAANIERDIRSGERWLIGLGITTLIVNTVIAFIYWRQLNLMKEPTEAAVVSADAAKNVFHATNDSLAVANQSLRLDKRASFRVTSPLTLNYFVVDPDKATLLL